jgi:hypothetical protein
LAIWQGRRRPVTRTLTLIALTACGTTFEESQVGHMRQLSAAIQLRGSGQRVVKIPVADGETALLATLQPTAPAVGHVMSFAAPDDLRIFDATSESKRAQSKTNAGFLGPAVSLNWPIITSDTPLREGDWRIGLGIADSDGFYRPGEGRLDVLLKSDDDLTSGTLQVAIVFAGDTGQDPELVDATRSAVEYWTELYAAAGITVEAIETDYPEGQLQPPGIGSDEHYIAISEATGIGVVNVVIAPSIIGVEDVYGVAGDIPGPLMPTVRTAVLVSVEDARGPDGEFNSTELRIYGETLAHETGHILGLFHPVETTLDIWDALPDTPECTSDRECTRKLSENLMYPFPVCNFITCTPQTVITDDQALVAHRYVGVD